MDYIIYYGIGFLALIITVGARSFIQASYRKYLKVQVKKNISGAEAAREILNKNGLKNIYVVETSGTLTDHYDPERQVIRLSKDIYDTSTVSAIAVASHECGHALQDKNNYALMRIRSSLVPFVNLSTKIGYVILLIGLIASITDLIWVGIGLEAVILLFHLITLPVEIDASMRAIREIEKNKLLNSEELQYAKTVLVAAALTYVASVATAVLEILRLIIIYGNRNRD